MQMRYHPQYRHIWFMSSEPSLPIHDIPSTSSSLEDNDTFSMIVPPTISHDPLYSHIFHCEEDILEELTTPDWPWNFLHRRALFNSQEVFHPLALKNPCTALCTTPT
jgi:hypothetical protein